MPNPQRARQVARVAALAGEPKSRHTVGLPGANAETLPLPDVLLLETSSSGAHMLYRFTADGVFGGDTWHQTLEDALHQVEFEYGTAVGPWIAVPDDVDDALDFARRHFGFGGSAA